MLHVYGNQVTDWRKPHLKLTYITLLSDTHNLLLIQCEKYKTFWPLALKHGLEVGSSNAVH